MNRRKLISLITILLISIILVYFYSLLIAQPKLPEPQLLLPPGSNVTEELPMEKISDYIRGVILLLMTSLGIFFNILWERKPNDKTPLLHLNNLKPLLISPIIFSSIYFTSKEIANNIAVLLFAFQNGFFWQGIFTVEQTRHHRN